MWARLKRLFRSIFGGLIESAEGAYTHFAERIKAIASGRAMSRHARLSARNQSGSTRRSRARKLVTPASGRIAQD